MLDTIADIRARLGTCNQRDVDAATLLGIVDCLQANEARLRVTLAYSKELYEAGINYGYYSDGSYELGKARSKAHKIFARIEEALSTTPGPIAELISAVGTWLAAVESEDPDAEASAAENLTAAYERCVK